MLFEDASVGEVGWESYRGGDRPWQRSGQVGGFYWDDPVEEFPAGVKG